MQLIFHDRRPVPTLPTGDAWLTIERKGTFSLSIAAVAQLGLRPTDEVVLAEDAETNKWYLVPNPGGELLGFELRPRDKTSKALIFCGQHRARAYYQAHGLSEEKSVRSLVSATALEHAGVKLYPLTPQHPTQTPGAVVGAPADTLEHLAAIRKTDFPSEVASQPDVAPLPSDLPFLQDEQPGTAPEAVSQTTAAAVVVDAETRLEKLTDEWYDKDLAYIEENDLKELLEGLAAKPKKERDIVENTVLNRAKTERARRNKKGGKRG